LVFGGLSDNDSWSATAGNIIGGLIPGVGLAADIRDFAAAVDHVANGKEGAWFEMGASIIGFVPGGDIAKGIAKGITKSTAKATAKIGTEVVQEVAKVAKASTAKAWWTAMATMWPRTRKPMRLAMPNWAAPAMRWRKSSARIFRV
jgi:hypothetical protein